MVKYALKYGGLLMSALLTLALFFDLFAAKDEAYRYAMAFSALALFEGGAFGWSHVLKSAKNGQRTVAKAAMWFCIAASILSSGAQIILSTNLYTPEFDTGLVALITIVTALIVNVVGIFLYEGLEPGEIDKHRELDRQAKSRGEMYRIADKVEDEAFLKLDSMVQEVSKQVSDQLADELRYDTLNYILSQTRGGANYVQAPQARPIQIPAPGHALAAQAQRDRAEAPSAVEASLIDRLIDKLGLDSARGDSAKGAATFASQGTTFLPDGQGGGGNIGMVTKVVETSPKDNSIADVTGLAPAPEQKVTDEIDPDLFIKHIGADNYQKYLENVAVVEAQRKDASPKA